MENNLNQKVIRQYSHEFAEKVCDSYFETRSRIDNDGLMGIQPVKQVNLFVVRHLFDQWQQDTGRLESPFFDFSAPQVREAMDRLKNVLSRHIMMERATYQPLLEKAVEETLRLILSPYDYYKELISRENAPLAASYLKTVSKYIRINPFIINELIARLERENFSTLTRENARKLLDEVVDQLEGEPDDVEPHIDAFAQVHAVQTSALYGEEPENAPEPAPASEPEKPAEKKDPRDREVRTLHDNLVNKEQSTLADLHRQQKIEDIRAYLTINQRFMFVNSLFDGDTVRFNEVVDHIERQESADDAIHYLHAAFSEWDRESEEVEEFFEIVRRRLT